MRTYEMWFPGFDARTNRGRIRWELFLHRDVRDVLLTTRDDTLLVVFRGEPDPTGWARTLRQAGLPEPHIDGQHPGRIVPPPHDAAA